MASITKRALSNFNPEAKPRPKLFELAILGEDVHTSSPSLDE